MYWGQAPEARTYAFHERLPGATPGGGKPHTRELNGLESIQATSCRMMGFPRGGAASQRRKAVS